MGCHFQGLVPKLVLASIWLLLPGQAFAQERYFVIVFGSQSTPKLPNYTHTWATVVKVTCADTPGGQPTAEVNTVSWLPATLKVHTFAPCPEPGTNLDLVTTIRWANCGGQRVSYWGPFEIEPEFYQRFLVQKARLESGVVRYQAIDSFYGPENRTVSDCIHAVSDTDYRHSRLYYLEFRRFGESASEFIVFSMGNRGRINPCVTHDWVAHLIGLPCQPVIKREFAPRPWWH